MIVGIGNQFSQQVSRPKKLNKQKAEKEVAEKQKDR